MPLPELKYTTATVALNVPVDEPTARTAEVKNMLGQAHAPDTQARVEPELPDEAPLGVAFLALQGRASQVEFSQVQATLQLEFYEAYSTNSDLCRPRVAEKGRHLLTSWERVGARPVWEGIVIKLQAPMEPDESPARHIFETHLRAAYDSDAVHEAKVEVALRLQDRYYVTLGIMPYENRRVQLAGPSPSGTIRPWDGEVVGRGVEVTLDINNRYGGMLEKKFMRITEDDLTAMNDLAWQLVDDVAIPFARGGTLNVNAVHGAAV
jgi:hypothetical protein